MKDIFNTKCEAIVNPVNIVGVMGAGFAAIIKKKYPSVFDSYLNACKNKSLKIGTCLTVKTDNQYIINFPTKSHWKDPSKIEYIESGLEALKRHIIHYNISSIAIPALGSGLGGLNWLDVKNLINIKLKDLKLNNGNNVLIEIYDPL